MFSWSKSDAMGLLGILFALGLLVWLAYRGWSVLLLAPTAALVAAAVSREPLLAHWTQTFMGSAAQFLAQFFPLCLLGAPFGKLMENSGSVAAIARWMSQRFGPSRGGDRLGCYARTRNAQMMRPTSSINRITPNTNGTAKAAVIGELNSRSPINRLITPRMNDPIPPPVNPPIISSTPMTSPCAPRMITSTVGTVSAASK